MNECSLHQIDMKLQTQTFILNLKLSRYIAIDYWFIDLSIPYTYTTRKWVFSDEPSAALPPLPAIPPIPPVPVYNPYAHLTPSSYGAGYHSGPKRHGYGYSPPTHYGYGYNPYYSAPYYKPAYGPSYLAPPPIPAPPPPPPPPPPPAPAVIIKTPVVPSAHKYTHSPQYSHSSGKSWNYEQKQKNGYTYTSNGVDIHKKQYTHGYEKKSANEWTDARQTPPSVYKSYSKPYSGHHHHHHTHSSYYQPNRILTVPSGDDSNDSKGSDHSSSSSYSTNNNNNGGSNSRVTRHAGSVAYSYSNRNGYAPRSSSGYGSPSAGVSGSPSLSNNNNGGVSNVNNGYSSSSSYQTKPSGYDYYAKTYSRWDIQSSSLPYNHQHYSYQRLYRSR